MHKTTSPASFNRRKPALSTGDLWIKNLRLLDLDEEFDWPQVHSGTFAATDSIKTLNKRVYCAAWIFYKLFELYEPEDTRTASSTINCGM